MVSRNGAEGADYWQCAFVIRKGDVEETQRNGIEDLRVGIVEIAPFLRDRGTEFRDWSDLKLLTVRVDRLRQWYRLLPAESALANPEGDPNQEPRQFSRRQGSFSGILTRWTLELARFTTRPKHGRSQQAAKLKLNLFTYAGNIAYAKVLYDRQDDRPWKWSAGCWK